MQLAVASVLKETSDCAEAGKSPQLMRGPLDSSAHHLAQGQTGQGTRMRWYGGVFILSLTITPALAQGAPVTHPLDSGAVVRLTWRERPTRIGKLLAPLEPASDSVAYCRYPGPPCSSGSPSGVETRPTDELVSVEIPRGSRAGRGALIGAGVGAGVLGLGRLAFADQDSPAPSTKMQVAGAITFVALSAGVGALIGRGLTRWTLAP
jgi:hypothetical protein